MIETILDIETELENNINPQIQPLINEAIQEKGDKPIFLNSKHSNTRIRAQYVDPIIIERREHQTRPSDSETTDLFQGYVDGLTTWAENPDIESHRINKGYALELYMKELLKRTLSEKYKIALSPAVLDFMKCDFSQPMDLLISKEDEMFDIPLLGISIKFSCGQKIRTNDLMQIGIINLKGTKIFGNKTEDLLSNFGTTRNLSNFITSSLNKYGGNILEEIDEQLKKAMSQVDGALAYKKCLGVFKNCKSLEETH